MAKGCYIGVNGKAHKVKKGYVGVSGKARKIKKAYIGVGGKARICWSGGEPAYYGTISPLHGARYSLAATTVGSYALFGGGYGTVNNTSTSQDYRSTVDVYNNTLEKQTNLALDDSRMYLAAATIGNYALFAGGYGRKTGDSSIVYLSRVTAFSSGLTKTTANSLSSNKGYLDGTNVGDYAVFGSGRSSDSGRSSSVDAYSSSLVKSTPSSMSSNPYDYTAVTITNHALFGGGRTSDVISGVEVYDENLTKGTNLSLSVERRSLSSASVGDYALFFSGYSGSRSSSINSTVDIVNSTLTVLTPNSLAIGHAYGAATSLGNYAIVADGRTSTGGDTNIVELFDNNLVRYGMNLSRSVRALAATSVENYALFGGGLGNSISNVVDVITIE